MMWLHAAPLAALAGQWPQWRQDMRAAVDVHGGEPGPRLGVLRDLGHYAWQALRRRGSLRAASTVDIEWDGAPLA